MRNPFRVTFRFRILATVLVLVTLVVSIITFTMAHMFHADKSAYVSDLASVIAVHAAEEANVVLSGCRDRLRELGRTLDDPNAPAENKQARLEAMFAGMRGYVAVRFFEEGAEIGALVDPASLQGMEREAYLASLRSKPLPLTSIAEGRPYVGNSTTSPKLPTFTLAVSIARPAGRPPLVVAGVLDVGRILPLGRRSRAFEVFLVDAAGGLVSHGDPTLIASGARFDWVPRLGPTSSATVKEYKRGGIDMIGGFARVDFADLQAGAQIPRAAAFFATRRLLLNLVVVALALLLGVAIVTLVWSTQVTRSLTVLAEAAKVIGRGDFGVQVAVRGRDEMGELAGSFNRMAGELHRREEALKQTQSQLVQSEKMAAFGQLGAGIAHEVKNPLAGIQGLVQLTMRSLSPEDPHHGTFVMLEKEARRCRSIIDNLLKFARQEKFEREPTALDAVVADTVALMRHQLSLHGVEIRASLREGLPRVHGSANQIQQVLMNLLLNAQQAMEGRGRGLVELGAEIGEDGLMELRVRDDGPGIPAAVRARVFEPFFTTKPAGKGTGLGLSVTFGIIRDHGGTIQVESEEGRGTTFVIRLPLATETSLAPAPARNLPPAGEEGPEARAA